MKFVLPLVLFCSLAIAACSHKSKKETKTTTEQKQKQGPTVVDVIIATPHQISNTIEANGTVVANEFIELHPEISGRLTYLNIPEGRRIAKGTVVARINDADLRAQMGKLKVQLDLARLTEERYKKLLDINGINRADYDVALNQVNSLKADMAVLQAQIDKTVLRAPFSGVIGLRQTSPGAYVSTSSVLATMQQVDKVKIDFTVPEENAYLIRKGSYVAVEVDATSRQKRRALIIATEPQVNTSTRNLLVRALLEGSGNPGAFVKVMIAGPSNGSSILVPASAIIPEDVNKTVVTVKHGRAAFARVQTGIREASNVEVTSGLNPGDSIVISGVLFARPNAPLRVRSVKKIEDLTQSQ
jgi:membrane fusion protein, multidrug efflux system